MNGNLFKRIKEIKINDSKNVKVLYFAKNGQN